MDESRHIQGSGLLQVAAKARKVSGAPEPSAAGEGDDRLVRIRLKASPVAEEELSFAGVLSDFLARASSGLRDVVSRGEATQVSMAGPHLRLPFWQGSH